MIHIMKVIVMSIRGIILVTVANNIGVFGSFGISESLGTQYSISWPLYMSQNFGSVGHLLSPPVTLEKNEISAIQSVAKPSFILVRIFFID